MNEKNLDIELFDDVCQSVSVCAKGSFLSIPHFAKDGSFFLTPNVYAYCFIQTEIKRHTLPLQLALHGVLVEERRTFCPASTVEKSLWFIT